MSDHDDSLSQRVAMLERRARRDRTIAIAALLVLTATAQTTAPSTATSSAPITVRDASGASTTVASTGVYIRDGSGTSRLSLYRDSQGRPAIDFFDPSGNLRQTMYLSSNNNPNLAQRDSNGKVRTQLYLSSGKQLPNLDMQDENEKLRVSMFQGSNDGRGNLAVYASDGTIRGYLVGDEAAAYFTIKDRNQTARVVVGEYTSGVIGMDVRNSAGSVIWSTPAQ